jgi:hypothetical protein
MSDISSIWRGAERVHEQQARTINALSSAGIKFALCGSNATYVWIASVDESGVRQFRNVEILLQRSDSEQALSHLTQCGFTGRVIEDRTFFFDRDPFLKRFANEFTFAEEPSWGRCPGFHAPNIEEIETVAGIPVVKLNSLVRLQLGRNRLDDAVDIRDLIDVGLVDQSWTAQFPPELAARLQVLLDDPEG